MKLRHSFEGTDINLLSLIADINEQTILSYVLYTDYNSHTIIVCLVDSSPRNYH